MHTIYNLHVCNNWPVFLWSQKSYCMHFYTAVFLSSINKDVVHLHFSSEVLCLRSRRRVNLFDFFVCISSSLGLICHHHTANTFFCCALLFMPSEFTTFWSDCVTPNPCDPGENWKTATPCSFLLFTLIGKHQMWATWRKNKTSELGHFQMRLVCSLNSLRASRMCYICWPDTKLGQTMCMYMA